jgi:predicted permease
MSLQSFLASVFAQPRSWLRSGIHRNRLEDEMEAELADHLENLTADLIRAGQSPAEGARNARVALGAVTVHKEEMRASLGLRWWDELRADLQYGFRILRKSPGFTLIAATSLALAIGANTTIFSIAKQLLYQRINVPHPEQLRMLRWNGDGHEAIHGMWGDFDSTPGSGTTGSVFSFPVYQQLRAHNQWLNDLLAFKEDNMNATIHGNAQRVNAAMVTGNYFDVLEVRPQLGRALQASDDAMPSSGNVAVISDAIWLRDYDRSPAALGQTIMLNQIAVTVIGVAPRGFTGAKGVMESPDLYVPLSLQPVIDPKGKEKLFNSSDLWWVNVAGRIKPGVSDRTAQAGLDVQFQAAVRACMKMEAGETMPRFELADGSRGLHFSDRMFKKPIYVLLALTGFVLLLACANIANLMLARGSKRQREMSVRLAMGAGRQRIVRQLLTESLLLAALGGTGGLALGYLGRNILPNLLTNAWEQNYLNTPFDWGVFAFTAAVTLITGILFGLAPAWMASRTEVSSTLKETAQSTTRRRRGLSGRSIVAFQIALSTLLVVGAGLFTRTLFALSTVDVGFDADHLLLFEVAPPDARYPAGKDVLLHAQLEQRIAALPGVKAVTAAATPYIADNLNNYDFLPEGERFEDYKRLHKQDAEDTNAVGIHFFETMGIPILAGRGFGPQDTATSPKVAVINQALARKRFPNVDPIGRRFRTTRKDTGELYTIVGICADTRYVNLRDKPPAQFFLPYIQSADVGSMVYELRTPLAPASLTPVLRRVVQSVDPDLPIIDVRTQREQINATMQTERLFAALTAGFGVLALALACVGIYGIMAYSVANRRNEIGIRLALGAQPGQVRSMILRESTSLAVTGIVVGAVAALALTRLVKSMLYGIQPYDPATMAGGVLILLAVALAASWIPARRAAGVQPMEALRHE